MKSKKSKLTEWQLRASKGGVCAGCGRNLSYLTVDHIVPLSIIEMLDDTGKMKSELEENFQLLCMPCNKFKANRIDKKNPITKQLLLKLLE
jgi:5-methylcytosine-specific restriction endonuclease McrA